MLLTSLRKKRLERRHELQKNISMQSLQEEERKKLIFGYCRNFEPTFPLDMQIVIISYHSFCDTWDAQHIDLEKFNIKSSLNNCIGCKTNSLACAYGNFIVRYNGQSYYSWIIRIAEIENDKNMKFPSIGVIAARPDILLAHYKKTAFPGVLVSFALDDIDFDVVYKIGDLLKLSVDLIRQTIKFSLNDEYEINHDIRIDNCRLAVCFNDSEGIQLQLI
eukprot:UN10614